MIRIWFNSFFRKVESKTKWRSLIIEKMDLKGRIVIYTITGCPHCLRAKSKLRELELPYTDVNLDNFPQCREPLAERTGKNTVPQIFFNATHIGGNDDFQKLVEERENFEKLVEDVKNTTPPPEAPVPPDPSTAVEQDQDKSKKDESSGFSCEPDEYAKLVKEIKSSDIIQNHRAGLFTVHKNSFSGNDLVDWIVKAKAIGG
ncbi:uncharacterized protein LOC106181590 [Lingula anatina]|uniref:Uncharacterized protein LOC106181590 n=1 Tax=Lingula anatina TaxID=7574 RepID=A0A1S3KFR0_LINAN|nr:uncharacterized protein LOC106181590 [Lingula anatina]|eukprot:XP_013421475.1 uncharacterized protein LOC106181590 [Lingula anatina]